MTLRCSILFSFSGALLALFLQSGVVLAAPKDAEARKLAQDAIETDYLGTDFDTAAKKLKQALALCKGDACSPKVAAQIRTYLGIVYIAQEKTDEGQAEFSAALALDPALKLDPDLTNPEVKAAFDAAKSGAGAEEDEEAAEEDATDEGEEAVEPEPGDEPKKPNIADYKPSGKITSAMEAECPPDAPPDFPGCEKEDEGDDGEEKDKAAAKNFISFGVQQDFLLFSSGTNVCAPAGSEYSCFVGGGDEYFITTGRTAYPSPGNEIAGGFVRATIRILAGYDRLLTDNITAGARLGFAFGGGPTAPGGAAFVPVHAEVRGAYWFGAAPFAEPGFRPYGALGGGLTQVDAKVSVAVFQRENGQRYELDAWKKTGTTFVFAGLGAVYAISATHGPQLEAKFLRMFGAGSNGAALQLGYVVGF